jgi:hypothetical protein
VRCSRAVYKASTAVIPITSEAVLANRSILTFHHNYSGNY